MSHFKTFASLLSVSAVFLVVAAGATDGRALAQDASLTIDPNGSAAAPPPAPEPSTAGPTSVSPSGGAAAEETPNFYYGDYLDDQPDNNGPVRRLNGALPPTHTVRSGDTLWGLSSYYFNDAWHWPKVWGLNPEISNPHWIYPGNIVRLRDGVAVASALPQADHQGFNTLTMKAPPQAIGLQQMAYVDTEELEDAATIVGSVQEKSLLSTGDSIYLSYPGDKIPKVGDHFAIYNHGKNVKRDGKVVGAYVEVSGELTITFAKEGKRARAVVTRSLRPIEREMRVGPLELNFSSIKPVANEQQVDGNIVSLIGPDDLIGARAAIIVDRGSDDGVKVGNRFLVLRRGDAYQKVMKPSSNVGQDDADYPARAIGEVIIVQAGKSVSLGLVSFSIHEFGVGDRVYMRKDQ